MESVEFVAGKLALLEDMQVRISVLESKVKSMQGRLDDLARHYAQTVHVTKLHSRQVKTLQDVATAQEQSIADLIEAVQGLQTAEGRKAEQEFLDRCEAVPVGVHEGVCRRCERVCQQVSDVSDLCEGCMIEEAEL